MSTERLRAMVNRTREEGLDKSDAEREIREALSRNEAERKDLLALDRWLKHTAVVRADWEQPTPPDKPGAWELIAVCDGVEWHPMWESEEYEYEEINSDDWWPFEGETAYSEDFRALGFRVEIA